MAVKIRNVSDQEMQINTPYSLNVKITGGPQNVSVDGLPDNFYYHWNASRNRVQIRGTPENLVFDKDMVITADDQIKTRNYSVMPLLPAFNQNIRQNVIRGIKFTMPVAVENATTDIQVLGPWIGLKYTPTPDGFNLYGTIPTNVNFTKNSFEFAVAVTNQKGITTGTITLTTEELSDINFYILDGNGSESDTKVKVYPSITPSSTLQQTITKTKEFSVPSIPGSSANYVSIANDGTNLYLLHSKPQSQITSSSDLNDQIVVVSPATQNGQTAGIIRRFDITRHSNQYTHDITDIYYYVDNLYLLTVNKSSTNNDSHFIYYNSDNPNASRQIQTLSRGGGIAVTQSRLTAVLYTGSSPNSRNWYVVYPPAYTTGMAYIAESGDTYSTHGVIRNSDVNTSNVSMTSINNFSYILSSTLLNAISTVEIPTPLRAPLRRNEITLNPALTAPKGITHL